MRILPAATLAFGILASGCAGPSGDVKESLIASVAFEKDAKVSNVKFYCRVKIGSEKVYFHTAEIYSNGKRSDSSDKIVYGFSKDQNGKWEGSWMPKEGVTCPRLGWFGQFS